MITPQYGQFNGDPCRWTFQEAWVFVRLFGRPGMWRRWEISDILLSCRLISKEQYLELYPDLPPLPADAFEEFNGES